MQKFEASKKNITQNIMVENKIKSILENFILIIR